MNVIIILNFKIVNKQQDKQQDKYIPDEFMLSA